MQLHCHSFLLRLIKLIDFSYKTAFPPFYCIISLHPRKLDINHVVGTSHSRCIIVAHRAAEVHVNDQPAVALKLMDYHPMEVLVVHGKVRAKGCGIIVVDDRLVWVWSVIGAEVGDERRDFQFRYAPVTVGSGRQVCAPQSPGQMNSSSTPPVWLILPSTLTHFS